MYGGWAEVWSSSVDHVPSWESAGRAVCQEIFCVLWTRELHFLVQKSTALNFIRSNFHLLHTFIHLFKIHLIFNSHVTVFFPSGPFFLVFCLKSYILFFISMRTTCTAYLDPTLGHHRSAKVLKQTRSCARRCIQVCGIRTQSLWVSYLRAPSHCVTWQPK
jgi:hypothetical protein